MTLAGNVDPFGSGRLAFINAGAAPSKPTGWKVVLSKWLDATKAAGSDECMRIDSFQAWFSQKPPSKLDGSAACRRARNCW
jgi:hypothetical protein